MYLLFLIACIPIIGFQQEVQGATAGKMISPQSIAVATAATGMVRSEGKILKSALKVCLFYIVLAGLIVFFCGLIFGF